MSGSAVHDVPSALVRVFGIIFVATAHQDDGFDDKVVGPVDAALRPIGTLVHRRRALDSRLGIVIKIVALLICQVRVLEIANLMVARREMPPAFPLPQGAAQSAGTPLGNRLSFRGFALDLAQLEIEQR